MSIKHQHGGDITSFQKEYPDTPVYDFSANINPLGLPGGIRDALTGSLDQYMQYPDPQCRNLRAALGEYEGVPPEWIICGNGASDLISRIAWSLRPEEALLPAPTFAEYERALEAAGCEVHRHILREENGFLLDDSFPEAIREVGVVFLCNPNNPTGALTDPELIVAAQQHCRATGATLVIDECFLDFAQDGEQYSMKRYLKEMDNLVILRAFTKIFAIPGLRLGYALSSNKRLLEAMEKAGPLWNVSVPAQLCGVAATKETGYLAETRRQLPVWREQLSQGLAALGCTVFPSAANYVFFHTRAGLVADLRPKGILLRDCANFSGLADGYYRAAVRTQRENAVLLDAIKQVL